MRESQGLRSRQPRSIEIRTSLREDYSDVYTATALAAIEALAILDDDRKEVIALRTERRMSRYRDHQGIAFLDAAAEERIQMYMRAFQNDGTRITENLDFA